MTGNRYLTRCPVCEGVGFTDDEPESCSVCRGAGATATADGQELGQALSIFYGFGTALAVVDNDPTDGADPAATAERNRELEPNERMIPKGTDDG